MTIAARTIKQARENRYIGCSHTTLTGAPRVNKLAAQNVIAGECLSRSLVRLVRFGKCPGEQIIRGRTTRTVR
jgi:hypothetical protein